MPIYTTEHRGYKVEHDTDKLGILQIIKVIRMKRAYKKYVKLLTKLNSKGLVDVSLKKRGKGGGYYWDHIDPSNTSTDKKKES